MIEPDTITEQMEQLSCALASFYEQVAEAMCPIFDAFAESCRRFIERMRSLAYGTLRSYGIPHWLAQLIAQHCPIRYLPNLVDRR